MIKPVQKEHRKRKVTIRLTDMEHAFLTTESDICGLSLSAFIRKISLGQRISSKADLRVLSELLRLGGLLKHLHNETKGIYSDLTADALRAIRAYVESLSSQESNRDKGK